MAAQRVVKKGTRKATASATVATAEKVSGKAMQKTPDKPEKIMAAKKPGAEAKAAVVSPDKIRQLEALANVRKLLKAKQSHARQKQPWQTLDPELARVPHSGLQSSEAAEKAEALHAGESRMDAIQGSINTQDSKAQGKRDSR